MSKIDIKEFVKPENRESKPKNRRDSRMSQVVGSVILLGIVLSIYGILAGVRAVANWGSSHEIVSQKAVSIEVKLPFRIEERKPQVLTPIQKQANVPELKTDIEKYICEKWGAYECKMALAVAKAESGLREDALNINRDSIDYGIFQINSVHFKDAGCSLKEISDQYKNVDCAYKMWQEQGWNAWVAYLNESYLAKY